jgi:predicted Zn-dependent protease
VSAGLRVVVWLVVVLGPAVLFRELARGPGLAVGAALGAALFAFARIALPRLAHAAFEAGRYDRAARRYVLLQWISVRAERTRAAQLSRTACFVAAGDASRAQRLLDAFHGVELDTSERAVWLNNRACTLLVSGGDGRGAVALALAEQAGALRPDVPALLHTRAQALLAVGRVDEAIAVLDAMRAGGELSARLEADRCRELAHAWRQKGEGAYADDYQLRADALGHRR